MTTKERIRALPYARLDSIYPDRGIVVEVPTGKDYLRVKNRGGGWADPKYPEWQNQEIPLSDPKTLAKFIHALAARYNLLVREINADVEAARMEPLTEVNPELPTGTKPLEAENKSLCEDKKRLDWLEAGGDLRRDFISAVAGAPAWWTKGPGPNYQRPHYRTAREAIDAAMREAQAAREYDRAG